MDLWMGQWEQRLVVSILGIVYTCMQQNEEKGHLITIYLGIFSMYVLSKTTNYFADQYVT